jgi:hypothetical protein
MEPDGHRPDLPTDIGDQVVDLACRAAQKLPLPLFITAENVGKVAVQKLAAIGVELFCVDDGWFGGRRDENAGLGIGWSAAISSQKAWSRWSKRFTGWG